MSSKSCLTRLAYLAGPALTRVMVAGALAVLGAGRLGAFSYIGAATALPALLYGALFVGCALALVATAFAQREHWAGRLVAGLGACLLVGFGADLIHAHSSVTSALILFWLAGGLALEALTDHD